MKKQGNKCANFHFKKGVVHRDLAARNVLLTTDQSPIISDFGYARQLKTESAQVTSSDVGPLVIQ